MSDHTDFEKRALGLLQSIDQSLKKLVLFANRRATAGQGPQIASDTDLDGRNGDEKIKFDPRDWKGPSFKGSAMSECSPEYLDEVARAYDYFADKNDREGKTDDKGNPKSMYDRRTAGRARGWAKRLRSGWKPPPPPPPMTDDAGADAFGQSDFGSGNFPSSSASMPLEDDPFAVEPEF